MAVRTEVEAAPRSRSAGATLWLVLGGTALIAVIVRAIGLGWGIPYVVHADESTTLSLVQAIVANGDLNPHFFDWPSLSLYVQAIPYSIYTVGREVVAPDMLALGSGFMADPAPLWLGRLTTLMFGVGIAVVGAWLTWWVLRSPVGAAAAGLLLAVNPLLVEHSRFMTPDTFAAFFALAATALAVVCLERDEWWLFAAAGAFAGAAASSKYNAGLVLGAIVVAQILKRGRAFLDDRRLYIAAAAALGTFLMTTPGALFSFSEFIDGLGFDVLHYGSGHPGAEGGAVGFYTGTLVTHLGALVVSVPLAFLGRSTRRPAIVLVMYPAALFVLSATQAVRFERNILGAVAPLTVLGVLGIAFGTRWLAGYIGPDWARFVAVALVAMAATSLFVQTMIDTSYYLTDPQQQSREWLEANLEPGDVIVIEHYSPYVDPAIYEVVPTNFSSTDPAAHADTVDYIVVTERGSGRFLLDPDTYSSELEALSRIGVEFCLAYESVGRDWVRVYARECG